MDLRKEYRIYLLAERGLQPETCGNHDRHLDEWEAFLAGQNKDLLEAQPADTEVFLGHLKHRISDVSVSNALSNLRAFYAWLTLDGRIERDPTAFIRIRKTWTSHPKSISELEVAEMLAPRPFPVDSGLARVLMLRNQAILEFLYGSGPRASEVVHAKMQNLDIVNRSITVRGKGNKDRAIPITIPAAKAMAIYLIEARPFLAQLKAQRPIPRRDDRHTHRADSAIGQTIFLSVYGMALSPSSLNQIIRKRNRTASPHTLRHSCATHMADHGADIRAIQRLLGHTNLRPTNIYVQQVSQAQLTEVHSKCHPGAKRNYCKSWETAPLTTLLDMEHK